MFNNKKHVICFDVNLNYNLRLHVPEKNHPQSIFLGNIYSTVKFRGDWPTLAYVGFSCTWRIKKFAGVMLKDFQDNLGPQTQNRIPNLGYSPLFVFFFRRNLKTATTGKPNFETLTRWPNIPWLGVRKILKSYIKTLSKI